MACWGLVNVLSIAEQRARFGEDIVDVVRPALVKTKLVAFAQHARRDVAFVAGQAGDAD